eukprot:1793315-Amphidinium_carterae.8
MLARYEPKQTPVDSKPERPDRLACFTRTSWLEAPAKKKKSSVLLQAKAPERVVNWAEAADMSEEESQDSWERAGLEDDDEWYRAPTPRPHMHGIGDHASQGSRQYANGHICCSRPG